MSERDLGVLEAWLATGYAPAYRTAWLMLRDAADAEDAVQEAFLRAWRFRSAVPDAERAGPWLYRLVVRACLSKRRAERRHGDRGAAADLDEWSDASGGLDEGTSARVGGAVAQLPDDLRALVALRYYAGLSEREIATVVHRRPGTVTSRLHEAQQHLCADPALATMAEEQPEAHR